MMTCADPSMAWATGLDGLLSWLAIWAADRPARTCGLYCAPARMYRLAMSRNGTAPDWSALFAEGSFLYGRYPQAILLTVVFVISGAVLARIVSRTWTNR